MYWLMGLDTVLRIAIAFAILFVAVPALAWPRPKSMDRLEWFWWNLGAGILFLTLLGQLLTLLNVHSVVTTVAALGIVIVVCRARYMRIAPRQLVRDLYRASIVIALNVVERRIHVGRRIRRLLRRARALPRPGWRAAGWSTLVAVAAAMRFYRPFASANLGFSDSYVHLYLLRLLQEGRQVDPAWGPYPRGMHFLLLTIHELTNVDPILLMNFFGAFVGILMTIAVADAARRLARSDGAGLFSGALYALMTGGASQYFLLGGAFITDDVALAHSLARLPYGAVPAAAGEFDTLLTVFERQSVTLPQELATVLLFPAALFLFTWLLASGPPARSRRTSRSGDFSERAGGPLAAAREGRSPTGFALCTAAIAAVHSGVLVPLAMLSAIGILAATPRLRDAIRAAVAGLAAIVVGSSWMLGYIAYPRLGGNPTSIQTAAGARSTALYYFPMLRSGELARVHTIVSVTPFIVAVIVIALLLLLTRRREAIWTGLATLAFAFAHLSATFGLPELVETRRNVEWFAMSIAIALGVAAREAVRPVRVRYAVPAAAALVLILWLTRVPSLAAEPMHSKLIDYSGYGSTAYAALRIERQLEPFTWTLVTYGQEFPMVLGRGFHIDAEVFLDRYDPAGELRVPTKYVFIAVEKTPHPFQINTWAARFSRSDLEERLQTWCFLYQTRHRDMRVWYDDANVRVYVIQRSDAEADRIAKEAQL